MQSIGTSYSLLFLWIPSILFGILIIWCFGHRNMSYFKTGCDIILSASRTLWDMLYDWRIGMQFVIFLFTLELLKTAYIGNFPYDNLFKCSNFGHVGLRLHCCTAFCRLGSRSMSLAAQTYGRWFFSCVQRGKGHGVLQPLNWIKWLLLVCRCRRKLEPSVSGYLNCSNNKFTLLLENRRYLRPLTAVYSFFVVRLLLTLICWSSEILTGFVPLTTFLLVLGFTRNNSPIKASG